MWKRFFCFTLLLCIFLGGCGDSAAVSYNLEASSGQASDRGDSKVSQWDQEAAGSVSQSDGEAAGSASEGSQQEESMSASGGEDRRIGIYVHVCGAVQVPGVYELAEGSRVYQALEAAGGLTQEADEKYLNQAELLQDGQQIRVYTREEVAAGAPVQNQNQTPASAGGESQGTDKVNLNTAGKDQLLTLPGIGDTRAEAILAYREANGNFASIEEIMNVEGIKEKMYEKLKDYIEV